MPATALVPAVPVRPLPLAVAVKAASALPSVNPASEVCSDDSADLICETADRSVLSLAVLLAICVAWPVVFAVTSDATSVETSSDELV